MSDITLMSDEDFLNNFDSLRENAGESGQEDGTKTEESEVITDPAVVIDEGAAAPEVVTTEVTTTTTEGDATAPAVVDTEVVDPAKTGGEAEDDKAKPVEGATEAAPVEDAPNYQDLYAKVMAPFKANGKDFTPQSPEEVIKLMQLGANYGKKMQELQPARKAVAMLENAGLLGNEDDLSLLIDIRKGDKAALQTFIKNSGIDIFDLDSTKELNYVGGLNKVSDTELNFRTTVEEVVSQEGGQEIIQMIDKSWDRDSQNAVWENPQILTQLVEARRSGTFTIIDDEINRRRTLGLIPAGTPYLQAYTSVGADLVAKLPTDTRPQSTVDTLPSGHTPTPTTVAQPIVREPVATRAATPKTEVSNGEQAAAAAATRSTPSPAKTFVNPLEMDDETFMKQFGTKKF